MPTATQQRAIDRRARNTVLKAYASYNFRDKDPVIYAVRDLRNKVQMNYQDIANRGGPSVSTMYKWDYGEVRCPQTRSVYAAVYAMGVRSAFIDKQGKVLVVVDPDRVEPRLKAKRRRKTNGVRH